MQFLSDGTWQKAPLTMAHKKNLMHAELVIFCLKAYHYQAAFNDYLPFISPSTPLILCHNGMLMTESLPAQNSLLTLLTTHASKKHQAFAIEHTGQGTSDIGLLCGNLSAKTAKQLTKVLNNALPETIWSEHIQEKQWRKLAINCVINPLTAMNNCDNGAITRQKFLPDINAILSEFIQVAQAQQINFNLTELTALVLNVAQSTATNCSSMRSDILHNRPTEIAHINGFIVRLGKKLHIETPINYALTQAVTELSNQGLPNKKSSTS